MEKIHHGEVGIFDPKVGFNFVFQTRRANDPPEILGRRSTLAERQFLKIA
jgi:hypothetical protein